MEILEKNKEVINRDLVDRGNVFYWQTDRNIEPEKAGEIWSDRHKYFTDDEIINSVNLALGNNSLVSLEPLDYNAQTSLGNVNSVRVGRLQSGQEVVIRNHPRGIENGYFYSESLASEKSKELGLPSYSTLAIHELENVSDYSFQVIEKLPGIAVVKFLEDNPEQEEKILFEIGKTMAKLHNVKVEGFGPFDNLRAKDGRLEGVHQSYEDFMNAGLDFNLDVLQNEKILNAEQVKKIKELFRNNMILRNVTKAVLVHNDFADWNLLTDGDKITGVVDFDEAVAGNPIQDIACWSTFFDPERLDGMLKGYWKNKEKPQDFQEKFELFRLRYIISKMTLRIRRYGWDPTEFMEGMIEKGKIHLKDSLEYFEI